MNIIAFHATFITTITHILSRRQYAVWKHSKMHSIFTDASALTDARKMHAFVLPFFSVAYWLHALLCCCIEAIWYMQLVYSVHSCNFVGDYFKWCFVISTVCHPKKM